jgi:hypothetical protein
MGFVLGCLLIGVVLLEEIERVQSGYWNGWRTLFGLLLLPTTRRRPVFVLCAALGCFFIAFEVRQVVTGRGTFNLMQGLAILFLLIACGVVAVKKK